MPSENAARRTPSVYLGLLVTLCAAVAVGCGGCGGKPKQTKTMRVIDETFTVPANGAVVRKKPFAVGTAGVVCKAHPYSADFYLLGTEAHKEFELKGSFSSSMFAKKGIVEWKESFPSEWSGEIPMVFINPNPQPTRVQIALSVNYEP